MDRITRRDVEGAFGAFIKSLGGRVAADYRDVGAYQLDHHMGAYRIVQIVSETGGERNTFGGKRYRARPFYDMLWFATEALRIKAGA